MLRDKRTWLGLIAVIFTTYLLGELNTIRDLSEYPSFMMFNVCLVFMAAVVGGLIANRHQFVILWTVCFLLWTANTYWGLYNIPGGTETVWEFLARNSGWGGLMFLGGVLGVHVGVGLSAKFSGIFTREA